MFFLYPDYPINPVRLKFLFLALLGDSIIGDSLIILKYKHQLFE